MYKIFFLIFYFNVFIINAETKNSFSSSDEIKEILIDKLNIEENSDNVTLPNQFEILIDQNYMRIFNGTNYQIQNIDINKSTKRFNINVTSNPSENYEIRGGYKVFTPIIAASHKIMPGNKISENDIKYVFSDLSNKNDYFTEKTLVIGRISKNIIPSGKLISHSYLTMPNIINKGQKIAIIYKNKGIILKMNGVALENGKLGDTIKIHNPRSNSIIYGFIESENLVIVGND